MMELIKFLASMYLSDAIDSQYERASSVNLLKAVIDNIAIENFVKFLHSNKLSAAAFSKLIEKSSSKEQSETYIHKLRQVVETDLEFGKKYWDIFEAVINALNKSGVEYALIKYYTMRHIVQLDIDLLIYDPEEILKACEVLHNMGYRFYTFRFFARPLEFGAKNDSDMCKDISVEIHRGIISGAFAVGDPREFLNRKFVLNIDRVSAFAVPLEENLYSLIIGSWFSREIPLSLVFEFLKLYKNIDVQRILEYGEEWGTVPAIHLFLEVVKKVSKTIDIELYSYFTEIMKLIDTYSMQNTINAYVNRLIKDDATVFPLRIPLNILLRFYPVHAISLWNKISFTEFLHDCYCHLGLVLLELYSRIKSFAVKY